VQGKKVEKVEVGEDEEEKEDEEGWKGRYNNKNKGLVAHVFVCLLVTQGRKEGCRW